MKTAIVICVLIAINAAFCKPSKEPPLELVTYQQRVFEDIINATINSIAGIAARYDPLHIDHEELNLLGHHGEITNLHVEGYSNVVASHIKLSGLITWTLELVLELPAASGSVENWQAVGGAFYGNGSASHHGEITNLHVEGYSNVVASHIKLSGLITWTLELVLELPAASGSVENWQAVEGAFYGNGSASAQIENIKMSIVAKVNPLIPVLKDLRIKPSIGNAQVSITGLYNDDELSQKVSNTITNFLNFTLNENTSLHDKISQIAKALLEKVLDKILGKNKIVY